VTSSNLLCDTTTQIITWLTGIKFHSVRHDIIMKMEEYIKCRFSQIWSVWRRLITCSYVL